MKYDIVIIGGGPAGMAAAAAAHDSGAEVCLVEREERIGGILKQCIHDGFGLIRFGERLTGPEYAWRYCEMIKERNITVLVSTFVTAIKQESGGFRLDFVNPEKGCFSINAGKLIMAMGCRERSDRQVFIHGDRPSGIFTAGQAQNLINLKGLMTSRKCVILGSGDIGLIMARRLSLEGAEVEGVYEIKSEPSGLSRNIAQCLDDFGIPLHLSTTVKSVRGRDRLEAVTVCKVDSSMQEIPGTERTIECDSLILSVGLIPENDILEPLNIPVDPRTKGPEADQMMQTRTAGIYSCGNALHVNDLVDYVSESGERAGKAAAAAKIRKDAVEIETAGDILYCVPTFLDPDGMDPVFYFRSSRCMDKAELEVSAGGTVLKKMKLNWLKPPEMERFELPLAVITEAAGRNGKLEIKLTEIPGGGK